MFAVLKRERGRRAGKGRKRHTWSWKGKKNFPVALNSLYDLLSTGCLVKSTNMKVQFASGAKNKFAAIPRTRKNQTRISFVISWEKFLGWNFLPFHRSSRLTLNLLLKKFHTLASSTRTVSPNWSEFQLHSEPMFAPKPVAFARLDAHVS